MQHNLENLSGELNRLGLKDEALQIKALAGLQDGRSMKIIHFILDAVGLVPGYGEAADFANAILYISEGRNPENLAKAGLSLVSCIPGIGDAASKTLKWSQTLNAPMLEAAAKAILKHERKIRHFFKSLKHGEVAQKIMSLPGGEKLLNSLDEIWGALKRFLERKLLELAAKPKKKDFHTDLGDYELSDSTELVA